MVVLLQPLLAPRLPKDAIAESSPTTARKDPLVLPVNLDRLERMENLVSTALLDKVVFLPKIRMVATLALLAQPDHPAHQVQMDQPDQLAEMDNLDNLAIPVKMDNLVHKVHPVMLVLLDNPVDLEHQVPRAKMELMVKVSLVLPEERVVLELLVLLVKMEPLLLLVHPAHQAHLDHPAGLAFLAKMDKMEKMDNQVNPAMMLLIAHVLHVLAQLKVAMKLPLLQLLHPLLQLLHQQLPLEVMKRLLPLLLHLQKLDTDTMPRDTERLVHKRQII